MIYILLANGASVIPQFVPILPQAFLLLWLFLFIAKMRPKIKVGLLFVLLFLCIIIFAGFLQAQFDSIWRFLKFFFNALIATVLAFGMAKRYENRFSEVYSYAMLGFTLIGILGLIFNYFNSWSVVSSIGDRDYYTNFMTTWLKDGDFESSKALFSPFQYRLQSMFDEPGTFGILLVPAFFFFVFAGNFFASSVLLFGAFLSESANAWILCGLIIIVKAVLAERKSVKLAIVIILLIALFIYFPVIVHLYEVKTGIDEAYANSSSAGVRFDEYTYFLKNWLSYIIPFADLGFLGEFPGGISVSYIYWYLQAGFAFAVIFLIVAFSFFFRLVSVYRDSSREGAFAIVLGATLLLSGFQRSSFLDNILFMTLTFWAIFYSDINKRAKLTYESP